MQDSVADKGKEKWRYLQKYWHKGAYFQENTDDVRGTTGMDSIFTRDFSGPTGEDKFDKTLMPAVMQVSRRWMIDDLSDCQVNPQARICE